MPGRSCACAWSFHTLRRLAREQAVLHDLAEQVDRVGVRRSDGHVRPGLPTAGRGDRDLEPARFEAVCRPVDLLLDLRLALRGREEAGYGCLPRPGAHGVGHGEVVVEDDPELDDAEEE